MTNYWESIQSDIAKTIKKNGNQEITGLVLQYALKNIINAVGQNATFAGVATPTTSPGTPDGPVFYLASKPGIYSNFLNLEVKTALTVLYNTNTGSWRSLELPIADGAITTDKIANGAVTESKMGTDLLNKLISDSQRAQLQNISFEQNNGDIVYKNQPFIVLPHKPTNPDTIECDIYRLLPIRTKHSRSIHTTEFSVKAYNKHNWVHPQASNADGTPFFNTITVNKVKGIPQFKHDLYYVDTTVLFDFLKQCADTSNLEEYIQNKLQGFIAEGPTPGRVRIKAIKYGKAGYKYLLWTLDFKDIWYLHRKYVMGLYNEIFGLIPIEFHIHVTLDGLSYTINQANIASSILV